MKISRRTLVFQLCVSAALLLPGTAWAGGAVYAMANALASAGGNQIVVWGRATDGTLTYKQTIATGGTGSGVQIAAADSLGSQGALVLDVEHHHLFAVNTNSHGVNTPPTTTNYDCNAGSITSFLIAKDGTLTVADNVPSGGLFPDSLTVQGNSLYVLNAGGGLASSCGTTSPNITGFHVSPDGHLRPITGSTQPINPGPTSGTGENCSGFATLLPYLDCGLNPPAFPRSPAQIGFTPDGDKLVVTVKGTNSIYVFPFDGKAPGAPTITQAPGPTIPTYFGFSFDDAGHLIVAEPFGTAHSIPAAGASAVSSFTITRRGDLIPISTDVANAQALSCWVAIDPITQRYAYIDNNGSNNISSYTIGHDGSLTLLQANAATGSGGNDMAVARDRGGAFLYALNATNGKVGAWTINHDGSLTSIGAVTGLPAAAGAQGLAAY